MDYYFRYKKYKRKYLELKGGNPLIDRVRELVQNFKVKNPGYNSNSCDVFATNMLEFISGCKPGEGDVFVDGDWRGVWEDGSYNLTTLPRNNPEISLYYVIFGGHDYILATLLNEGIIIQSFHQGSDESNYISVDNWLEGENLESKNISEEGISAIQKYGQYQPFNLTEYLDKFTKDSRITIIEYHGGVMDDVEVHPIFMKIRENIC